MTIEPSYFISMVSHELRTPLTSLKESMALLEETLKPKLDDQEVKIFDLAQRNLERLLRFTQEVLDFSSIESGKLTLNKRKTKIQELLASLVEIIQHLAKKKAIHLILKIESNLPEVSIDPDKISQIVLNLLHNSIKFTPLGGRVALTASRANGQFLLVSVEDNGVGIPKEFQMRIFEPFVHLNQPGNCAPGAGLGLSISKKLIELHGGKIFLDSAGKNKGCRFTLELPLKQ